MRLFGTSEIRHDIAQWIDARREWLRGKVVVDLPAGEGDTSRRLAEAGADVRPYDLFPETFAVPGLACRRADLSARLPIDDAIADLVVCQEGIEHIPNQLNLMRELARVVKPGGLLLITTPNYSNLRSRWSYLVGESEMYKLMPPNEVDSVWRDPGAGGDDRSADTYFGHVFSIGIQKLRLLAVLAGLRLRRIHHLKINGTSLFLLPLFYPWIAITGLLAYRRARRKTPATRRESAGRVYREVLRLGVDPRVLIGADLFVELEKTDGKAPPSPGSGA